MEAQNTTNSNDDAAFNQLLAELSAGADDSVFHAILRSLLDELEETTMSSEWKERAKPELDWLREQKNGHPKKELMINTILALVDARLAGTSQAAVFNLPNTCSENTYKKKWKRDPDFAQTLDKVTKLALDWKDGRALEALEKARERLALLSPPAATKLGELLSHPDPIVARQAAVNVLDRAGVQTAVKTAPTVSLKDVDPSKLTKEQRDRINRGEDPLKVLLEPYMLSDE